MQLIKMTSQFGVRICRSNRRYLFTSVTPQCIPLSLFDLPSQHSASRHSGGRLNFGEKQGQWPLKYARRSFETAEHVNQSKGRNDARLFILAPV